MELKGGVHVLSCSKERQMPFTILGLINCQSFVFDFGVAVTSLVGSLR